MMKVSDFLTQLKKAASSSSLYVMGGWGFPLTASNKDRTQSQPYNRRPERKSKIYAAASDVFAFDCCGLPRSILWGWDGDVNAKNGGAIYCSNGVPEYDAKQFMFQGCTDPTTDFSQIDPGEFLWFDGHCGVYLGDGKTIESTPSGSDGVQIRAFDSRWKYHGHLKYVDYSGVKPEPKPEPKYHNGGVYVVNANNLHIRTDAGTGGDILMDANKGDKVKCYGTKRNKSGRLWLKIGGWICAQDSDGTAYIKGDD